jgi:hypothetical protein
MQRGFAYLERELQQELTNTTLPAHYSALLGDVQYSQQVRQQAPNLNPDPLSDKNDEVFTPKREPLIRVPDNIEWSRSEWVNIFVGRLFKEMQTCKVLILSQSLILFTLTRTLTLIHIHLHSISFAIQRHTHIRIICSHFLE